MSTWERLNEAWEQKRKGGTEKIRDTSPPCSHPEHSPPSYCVFEPGEYRHTCPACGHITYFRVPHIFCCV